MSPPDFRLEISFSRWESAARHELTASDAQTPAGPAVTRVTPRA